MNYMKGLFEDWQAKGITSVLHEKKGGYANNTASIYGLAAKAEGRGRAHHDRRRGEGLRVRRQQPARSRRSLTNKGRIACDYVVVGAGPWVNADLEFARAAEERSRSRAAMGRCMTMCRCGNTGAWRRARSASIPSCTRPMTAGCRRSSMSIPTHRFIRIVDG